MPTPIPGWPPDMSWNTVAGQVSYVAGSDMMSGAVITMLAFGLAAVLVRVVWGLYATKG